MVAFKVADDRNAYGNRWKKWTTRIILPISSSIFILFSVHFFATVDLENHFPFLEYSRLEIFLKIFTWDFISFTPFSFWQI